MSSWLKNLTLGVWGFMQGLYVISLCGHVRKFHTRFRLKFWRLEFWFHYWSFSLASVEFAFICFYKSWWLLANEGGSCWAFPFLTYVHWSALMSSGLACFWIMRLWVSFGLNSIDDRGSLKHTVKTLYLANHCLSIFCLQKDDIFNVVLK